MSQCRSCQKPIPPNAIIDGRMRCLNSRKFCLECSPWGKHNTRKVLDVDLPKIKFCSRCKIEKPSEEFYIRRKGTDLSSYCKVCTCEERSERCVKTKKLAIEYLGGQCRICGYNRYYGTMHFHHRNRSEKEFGISQVKGRSFERIKAELDKCVLLCSRCHDEVEGGIVQLPVP